jgi:hypothetical protein
MSVRSVTLRAVAAAGFAMLAFSAAASADTFSTIYQFQGAGDGANPRAALLHVSSGTFYGVTTAAGAGSGTFFSLTPPATAGGTWTETSLLSFVADGTWPSGDLAIYKTGFAGTKIEGAVDPGSLYQLKLTTGVPSVWKEFDIHDFGGTGDGTEPLNGLTRVAPPSYYTATQAGGVAGCKAHSAPGYADGCGAVIKTVPPVKPGGSWTETVLYAFTGGTDGANPASDLFSLSGTFYGTTALGGAGSCKLPDSNGGCGIFYQITPAGAKTKLYDFQGGKDGAEPQGKLIHVGSAFFGVTEFGGGTGCGGVGCGTVFRLLPPAIVGGPWVEKVMYTFTGGTDGEFPAGGLAAYKGYLYGTTTKGGGTGCGGSGCGTVFKVKIVTPGVDTIVHAFTGGSDGAYPFGTIIHVSTTGLIGNTEFGGTAPCTGGRVLAGFPGCGTVFQIQ